MFCHQESGSKGHVKKDVGRDTTEEVNFDTIFVPPPEFQSSPLDFQSEIKTVENRAEVTEDLFQAFTPNHMPGGFQTSTVTQKKTSTNGHFHDVTLNSPDLFKPIPDQTHNLSKTSQLKSSDLFTEEGVSLFQAAKGEDLLHAERAREVNLFDKSPSIFVDPFKSPLNKEDDLFQSPQPMMVNPFSTDITNEADLFQAVPTKSGELFHIKENKQDPSTKEDLFGTFSKENLNVFSPSSASTVDPFPSPIARDLFQSVSSLDDPFGATPSKQYNPFQDVSNGTPFDIFHPHPSKTDNKDIFEITPSNTASKATYSTPSLSSPSEMKLDMVSSPDLFKATLSESHPATRPKSIEGPHDFVLTTPQGTKHDILQPTPFTRARNLPVSLSQSPAEMTHVCIKCHLIIGQP